MSASRKGWLTLTIFIGLALGGTESKAQGPEILWPGMSLEQFRQARPGVVPEKLVFKRQLQRQGRFGELKGQWSFSLDDNTLQTIRFRHEGKGIFSLGGDDSARVTTELSLERKDFEEKLGDMAELLRRALKNPAVKTTRQPAPSAAVGDCGPKTLYQARMSDRGLDVRLSLHLAGRVGVASDNSDVQPLRHELEVTFSGRGQAGCIPGKAWYPGMAAADFAKAEPKLLPKGTAISGQWGEKQKLFGVEGEWAWSVKEGELDWFAFSRYWSEPEQINETNFKLGLAAARALVKHYTKLLGKPAYKKVQNTQYIDPAKKHHWGYEVLEARWKTPKGKLKVSFDFQGGKGQYFLLLKVGVFRPDYPFFD